MTPIPFPRVLRIEPASKCNLACSHCPTGTVDMDRGLMSRVVFDAVLSEIFIHKDAVKVIVLYHGGEPLLNNNFYDMVARIKDVNDKFFVKTVSNGMALTEKHAKDIIDSGIDLIEFSLDGISPDESQYIRVDSNTQRIINNIRCLIAIKKKCKSVKPEIYIATTQFLRDKNLTKIPNEPDVPAWLKQTFDSDVSGYKPTYALRWPHMGDSGKFDFFKPVGGIDGSECDHIVNTMTIRADGAVVPCCYDLTSKLVMGNLLEESLADIWNGEKYSILRESINAKTYSSICKTCAVVRPPVYLIPKWNSWDALKIEKSIT
jgi:radical SAM protein with 4Fe4S-binding SPASM domain